MNAPIDITGLRLETPRLILRPWEQRDLPDFFEYASVPGVGEMAGWFHHKSMEESREILRMFVEEKKTLALVEKSSGKAIGSIGLEESEAPPEGRGREVGYVLSKAFWGQGLMPEAVRAVIAYCFNTLGWDWLTCAHFENNSQSRRVIEKCGFAFRRSMRYKTRMGTVAPSREYVLYHKR